MQIYTSQTLENTQVCNIHKLQNQGEKSHLNLKVKPCLCIVDFSSMTDDRCCLYLLWTFLLDLLKDHDGNSLHSFMIFTQIHVLRHVMHRCLHIMKWHWHWNFKVCSYWPFVIQRNARFLENLANWDDVNNHEKE